MSKGKKHVRLLNKNESLAWRLNKDPSSSSILSPLSDFSKAGHLDNLWNKSDCWKTTLVRNADNETGE